MPLKASEASSGNATSQIDAFTTETSCLTIVWAVMQSIHLPRIPVNKTLSTHCSWWTSNQPKRVVQVEVLFFVFQDT
jgi:hypothetical protein